MVRRNRRGLDRMGISRMERINPGSRKWRNLVMVAKTLREYKGPDEREENNFGNGKRFLQDVL